MPVRGIRRRYLTFTIEPNEKVEEKEIWEVIRSSIQTLYGIKGISLIDPNLIKYDPVNRRGLVRCTHDTERYMRCALAYITSIKGGAIAVRVWRTSGTIKKLRNKANEY